MRQTTLPLVIVPLILVTAVPAVSQQDSLPVVRVGFVFDGPRTENREFAALHAEEIRAILRGEVEPRFPPESLLEGDHTLAGIARVIDVTLADPQVDVLVALGPLASFDVARRGPLPKPAIAAFAMDPEVLGFPLSAGTSGTPNLSYIAQATELRRDFEAFREIVPFSTLTLLANPHWADVPAIGQRAVAEARSLGIELQTVPVDRPIEDALAQIPADAEAVYLTPLLHLTDAEWDALVAELNARGLPTFSM